MEQPNNDDNDYGIATRTNLINEVAFLVTHVETVKSIIDIVRSDPDDSEVATKLSMFFSNLFGEAFPRLFDTKFYGYAFMDVLNNQNIPQEVIDEAKTMESNLPVEPGLYFDEEGSIWTLDEDGEWTDSDGMSMPKEYK